VIFTKNVASGWRKPLTISVVCAVLTGISYGFGIYLFPMVMPEMIQDLHLNYTHAGTITGMGQMSALSTVPLAAYLTGRIGGLRVIVACPLIGAVMLAAMYYVQGFYSLLVLNFLIRGWPIMVWIPLVAVAAEHIDFRWRATMLTASSSGACFFILPCPIQGITRRLQHPRLPPFFSWELLHCDPDASFPCPHCTAS